MSTGLGVPRPVAPNWALASGEGGLIEFGGGGVGWLCVLGAGPGMGCVIWWTWGGLPVELWIWMRGKLARAVVICAASAVRRRVRMGSLAACCAGVGKVTSGRAGGAGEAAG